jgi:hypothetical protein
MARMNAARADGRCGAPKGPRGWASLLLLGLLLFAPAARAALTVELDVQPRLLRIGEEATMSLTVRGVSSPERPVLPEMKEFQVSPAGTQQSVTIINGSLDRSVTFTYRLLPTKTGDHVVGPFTYQAGGEQASVPAVAVRVVAGEAAGGGGGEQAQSIDDLLFARLRAERREVYLQEVFEITLSVYNRGLNMGRETALLNMEASGLNFLPFKDLGTDREQVGGKLYEVHRFRGRAQAVAAGAFTLAPVVRTSVVVPRRGRGRGIFDDPFFNPAEVRQIDLRPPPLAVAVRPLPEAGRPPGFSGAVGAFTFAASVKPLAVAEGEPVTLTMEIRGRGNLEAVTAPGIAAGDGFKAYEAKLVKKEISEDRSEGHLVFEQVFIPRTAASSPLPAVTFSFFDPARTSYQRLAAGPFPLRVTPSANPGAVVVRAPGAGAGAGSLTLGADIVYLKPAPHRWEAHPPPPGSVSAGFLALQLLPLAAVVALFLGVRRREELTRDVAKARRQKAPKAAQAGIRAAEQALAAGAVRGFHEALWEALSAYFGHRLNLSPGEISGEIVAERLARAGFDPQGTARLGELFLLLEQERFGRPGAGAGRLPPEERQQLGALLDEVGRLLRSCEKVKL